MIMYNDDMHDLTQRDIDILDEISKKYGGKLLLPPINGSLNICIFTDDIYDLTPIHEALFYEGFSFFQKIDDNGSYIEIVGVHHFYEA